MAVEQAPIEFKAQLSKPSPRYYYYKYRHLCWVLAHLSQVILSSAEPSEHSSIGSPMASMLEVDVEVKCNAGKYWEVIRDSNNIFTKAFPDQYKCIKVLQGDGKSVGSVRHVTYGEGSQIISNFWHKLKI